MKLLKPTWVNHNGECAPGSRKAESGVEAGSGAGSEPRAGPALLAPDAPGARCPVPKLQGRRARTLSSARGSRRARARAPLVLSESALTPGACTEPSVAHPWSVEEPRLPPGSGPGRQPAPATRLQQPGCAQMVQCVKLGPSPLCGFSVAG